ncbi:coiled-coil domain-containing protein 70 [Leptodactylus fuscus]|uniref:coiled-coil domain-containing protein 70 n=1 Tax=Leptodactylus fuscus TaxID=238119 RepID=UPI003F4EB3E9
MLSWIFGLFMGTTEDETRKTKEKAKSQNEGRWNKEDKERTTNNPRLLSAEEGKQAKEAKEQTQQILSDVLKKKESLLVEDPKEFEHCKKKNDFCPLLTTDLVKDLMQELVKVTFAKNTDPVQDIRVNAYVYPGSEDRTIYLCALFWEIEPESRSRQRTIIHEVSHFLGYGHTVQENSDRVQKSPQSMLCPLDSYKLALAFTYYMDHPGTYRDGSYSCCGETSRDTVCEKSKMAEKLRLLRKMIPRIYGPEEDTDSAIEMCSSFEESDEEVDTAVLEKKLKRPVKRQTDSMKTKTNLQKTQIHQEKTRANWQKALANWGKALANRGKALANREKALANREKALANREKALANREKALANREKALANWGKALANWEKALANWEKALANREKALANWEKALANREKALANL